MIYKTSKKERQNYKDIIKFCLILDWGFSFMMWCLLYNANEKPNIFFVISVIAICFIKPILGFIASSKLTLNVHKITIYFGISTVTYSLMFFWMFYGLLYKVIIVGNPLYLVLGAIGYFVFFSIMLYYRCGVLTGKYKDRSGTPKYSIIGLSTIIGSIFIKGYSDKLGEDMKTLIAVIIALIISYGFSIGGVLLIERWVCQKFKKVNSSISSTR